MSGDEAYEIYAIRYARHDRDRHENFIFADAHDGPMPMDYFVWAIVGNGRTIVVDTGFKRSVADQRKREFLRCPGDGLRAIGIEPATVKDVVLTHLHYDHAGNQDLFPQATFHVQDREMAFCTGRCMCHGVFRNGFEADDVVAMVKHLFAGRVQFHEGTDTLAPGITLHHIGGHTMGLQIVRVKTRRGYVVLASDATHYYENMERGQPFPIVYNVGEMLEGYGTLRKLASSPAHIIPGHDPLVMTRYAPAKAGLQGIAVRLDLDPKL